MTLPKTFTLTSKEFNNFDTMSFETSSQAATSSNTGNHVSTMNAQQQQLTLNAEPEILNPNATSTSSSALQFLDQLNHNSNNTMLFNNADTVAAATAVAQFSENIDLMVENVMPGIYLTKNFISWKKEQLRAHGFTHVIIIDKHIQELYYPNQQPEIFKLCRNDSSADKGRHHHHTTSGLHDDYEAIPGNATLNFGKDFDVIDLNFGEKSYLTTVLPNCYRAVKFINKALQCGGTILVIDCNGGEQKCLTIIVAYLMYKHNISFSNAFARLKEFYKKADLDRFYTSQLYEYEPILQVQRAQSRGHSCSRELHAAILKRKKNHEDDDNVLAAEHHLEQAGAAYPFAATNAHTLLDNCNPLNRFDSTQMDMKSDSDEMPQRPPAKSTNHHNFTQFMSNTTTTRAVGGWYNWDDYAME